MYNQFMDKSQNKRIAWIDVAKGIGMLLVIFAHCFSNVAGEVIPRAFLYSFHMPLFFILSGFTFKFSEDWKQFRKSTYKSFKRLIIPAIICFIIFSIISVIRSSLSGNHVELFEYVSDRILALLFSLPTELTVYGITMPDIGMMWFFVALFFSLVIFNLIARLSATPRTNILLSLFVSLFGFLLAKYNIFLPFSIDLALSLQIFLLFGKFFLRKIKLSSVLTAVIYFIIWIITFISYLFISRTYLEVAVRRFPLFPVSIISALAGSCFIYCISYALSKIGIIKKALSYIGRNSLYVLIAHYFDFVFEKIWLRFANTYLNGLLRIIIVLILAFIIIQIKSLVQKYILHTNSSKHSVSKN